MIHKAMMEKKISGNVEKIAKKQAARFYWKNHGLICGCLDYGDFLQSIYERVWRANLWDCKDPALIYIVAIRACEDLCRVIIKGRRLKKNFEIVEYEEESSKIFDSHYYEMVSLSQLVDKLEPVKQQVVSALTEGHTLKEIGVMVNLTEGRICQIRQEIVNKLYQLYRKGYETDGLKKCQRGKIVD